MIKGIGTDLIRISRIRDAIVKHGDKFVNRIFTAKEKKYCKKSVNYAAKYANRFAGKEAVCKALGFGIGQHDWKDIEILNDDMGKPYIVLHNKAEDFLKSIQGKSIHISITDTHDYSMAFCIVED